MNRSTARLLRFAVVVVLLAGSFALISAEKPTWTTRDKAYFADPETVAFVRPGLEIELANPNIAPDGTASVEVTFTDPRGLPLDRNGVFTPGNISASLLLTTIPAGQEQYRVVHHEQQWTGNVGLRRHLGGARRRPLPVYVRDPGAVRLSTGPPPIRSASTLTVT